MAADVPHLGSTHLAETGHGGEVPTSSSGIETEWNEQLRTMTAEQVHSVSALQSAVRGQQARRNVAVNEVAPGITHVHVAGQSKDFDRLGFSGQNTDNGPKRIDYLKVDADKYDGHVLGGSRFLFDHSTGRQQDRYVGGQVAKAVGTGPVAYVNGGYYNMGNHADENAPPYTPIGEVRSVSGPIRSLPVPEEYKDQYHSLSFKDGSTITSAPVLARDGHAAFPESRLDEPRFQFGSSITPGHLLHAQHPNPRAALSGPDSSESQADYRLAVGLTSGRVRGAGDTGFTMPEWSRIGARLGDLDPDKRTIALNLDGGPSAIVGAADEKGGGLAYAGQKNNTDLSTIVAFSPKDVPVSADITRVRTPDSDSD